MSVTSRRIEAAICTLADLTTEDLEPLDSRTRDEISHVINALDDILDARAVAKRP